MSIPVIVLGHARPDKLRRVLQAVHESEPSILYVAIDGARDIPDEIAANALTKKVVDEFKWKCKVKKIYHPSNFGVRKSIETSLDAFFAEVPHGVVLEDDCLPNRHFFRFAEAVIKQYAQENSVGMFTGTNFLETFQQNDYDAIFTEGHIWGWGTWSATWQNYRRTESAPTTTTNSARYYGIGWPYRKYLINKVLRGEINSWAIPWLHYLAENNLLCAVPTKNTITNIGHDASGTHTTGRSRFSAIRAHSLSNTIRLPITVHHNRRYQNTYATRITLEHLIHTGRRPLVNLIKKLLVARTRES